MLEWFDYMVLINRLFTSWFGVYIFRGLVYLRGFDGLRLFWFGFLYGFLILCWFDVFLIFWGFLFFVFLMLFWCFFWFFYDFFSGGLNLFYSPKRVHSFTILLQFYFFCIYWLAWWGDTVECHRLRFTASSLVFNRICKSIKKYKTWRLGFSSYPCLQVAF